MRRTLGAFLLSVGLAGLFGQAASAKQSPPPDLTGTWVLDLSKSKPDSRLKIASETLVVTYSGQQVQLSYLTNGLPRTRTYIVDGKWRTTALPSSWSKSWAKGTNSLRVKWKKSGLDILRVFLASAKWDGAEPYGTYTYDYDNFSQPLPGGFPTTADYYYHYSERFGVSADGATLTQEVQRDWESKKYVYVFEKQKSEPHGDGSKKTEAGKT